MNPLNSVNGTIIAGVVLAVVIALATAGIMLNELSLIVWLHVLSGITWIGLLYYFNFVQVPALADAASDEGGPGGAGPATRPAAASAAADHPPLPPVRAGCTMDHAPTPSVTR